MPAASELPPGGAASSSLDRIDLSGVDSRLSATRLRVASDVRNRLCGPEGAAAVFGPQKGASPDDVRLLDAALAHFAAIALRDTGVDLAALDGGGAAGGLAAGLHVLGASVEPGFDLVAEIVGLEPQIARADLVLTGEGRLDDQTPYGKAAAGVAALARRHGKPVGAIAGQITDERAAALFDVAVSASPAGMSADDAMRDAATLVRNAANRAFRELSDRYSASR